MIEVVVIGGGIAGCATALALDARGAAVNLVEAEGLGAAATGASAGMLAPQYEADGAGPMYRLGVRARDQYREFVDLIEERSGHRLHLHEGGMLVANRTPAEHRRAEASVDWQTAEGQNARLVSPEEAAELQPGLGTDVVSWLWLPDERRVDTQALMEALPAALATTGVRVITGRSADRILARRSGVTGVVLQDGRTLDADRVVVAAGAWSPGIDGVPDPLPVRPIRGQMLRFPAGSASLDRLVATHDGRYLVPRADGTILAGSTMEDVGYDRSVTDAGANAIHRAASTLLPALGDAQPAERWADVRPVSGDGRPILGPEPTLEGLYYNTGAGRNGILLGPASGRITAALITDGTHPDWGPFSVTRFRSSE